TRLWATSKRRGARSPAGERARIRQGATAVDDALARRARRSRSAAVREPERVADQFGATGRRAAARGAERPTPVSPRRRTARQTARRSRITARRRLTPATRVVNG